jgi:DNA-binding IclR family transcriptional regulator
VQVIMEGERGERRPVAVLKKPRPSGPRVTVDIEREAFGIGSVFLLYRTGGGDLVLAASADRQVVETIQRQLGSASDSYRIASVPVLAGER